MGSVRFRGVYSQEFHRRDTSLQNTWRCFSVKETRDKKKEQCCWCFWWWGKTSNLIRDGANMQTPSCLFIGCLQNPSNFSLTLWCFLVFRSYEPERVEAPCFYPVVETSKMEQLNLHMTLKTGLVHLYVPSMVPSPYRLHRPPRVYLFSQCKGASTGRQQEWRSLT